MTRVQYFFNNWYEPDIHMAREDWLYLGALGISWIISFGLGTGIGLLIAR